NAFSGVVALWRAGSADERGSETGVTGCDTASGGAAVDSRSRMTCAARSTHSLQMLAPAAVTRYRTSSPLLPQKLQEGLAGAPDCRRFQAALTSPKISARSRSSCARSASVGGP